MFLFAADHWHVICCSCHWHVVCFRLLLTCCLLKLIINVVFVAADYWCCVCCSWLLTCCFCCSWPLGCCLLQLITGIFFCFRWSFPCYCRSCVVVVVVVVPDHFHVVCCRWLLTCCLLQPIIDVVYIATDHWPVVYLQLSIGVLFLQLSIGVMFVASDN